jgi:hypothetical protein
MAVVIEYENGPGEINTIVQSFNSSGIKAEPKLELETESHGTEAGYGTYIVTGDNLTNFLTPSGAWAQYPDFEASTGAYFHTNLDQTTAPYVATWLDPKVQYTHTQLDDAPDEGVAPEDFIMDGSIVNGEEYFGTGSTYFTNLYPGLFVLSAKSIDISSFGINGNIGADGSGEVETEIVNINSYSPSYSKTYTAYVKKVYESGDPSINQIIIIDTDGTGVSQSVDPTTTDDTHRLTGIDAATEIHYLLFAKTVDGSGYVTPEEIESVITEYLDLVDDQTLGDTLSVLNSSYSNITGVFPAYDSEDPDRIYYFSDAPDANSTIDDGGEDMYDDANIITTNLTTGREIKIFKSTGEVTQITLTVLPEMYFGRNGFFTIDVNNNSDLIIRTYDLDGNLITTSNSTHIDYEYGDYIEDRGGLITGEKYFDPEIGAVFWDSRFYMISYDMMEFVSVTLVDSSNRVKVISNDWGEWND